PPDLEYALAVIRSKGDTDEQRVIIDSILSKHEQGGLSYYWQGQLHLNDGEYAQAIQSFERALQFTRFKVASESGLTICLLGMADGPPGKPDKANPEAAYNEAKRLKLAHPHN